MVTHFSSSSETNIGPVLGALRSIAMPAGSEAAPRLTHPFVTISRQAGAGGIALANALAAHLNKLAPSERPWQVFDRALVERVVADHNLSDELVDSLEDTSHTWLTEFLEGLPGRQAPSELAVFKRLAATIRALAQAGRVILVGRGSGFITANMPAGLHLRLVAKLSDRIANLAKEHNLSPADAARLMKELDRNRTQFLKRYFPNHPLSDESFMLTLNASCLSVEEMLAALVPLIQLRTPIPAEPLRVTDVASQT